MGNFPEPVIERQRLSDDLFLLESDISARLQGFDLEEVDERRKEIADAVKRVEKAAARMSHVYDPIFGTSRIVPLYNVRAPGDTQDTLRSSISAELKYAPNRERAVNDGVNGNGYFSIEITMGEDVLWQKGGDANPWDEFVARTTNVVERTYAKAEVLSGLAEAEEHILSYACECAEQKLALIRQRVPQD